MKSEELTWSKGAFFVCEKCGRRKDADSELEGFAEDIKSDFKTRFREMGRHREVRVMISSCLGNCPPKKQAAAWVPNGPGPSEVVIFTKSEKEDVFDWLKKK